MKQSMVKRAISTTWLLLVVHMMLAQPESSAETAPPVILERTELRTLHSDVIQEEYELAKKTIEVLRDRGCRARMALSPVFGNPDFTPTDLILMIKNDRFWDVAVNMQLHKIINILDQNQEVF